MTQTCRRNFARSPIVFPLLIAGLLVGSHSLFAQDCRTTFKVTKIEDTADGNCSTSDCSLREAVIASNSCPGTNYIQLTEGDYLLTRRDSLSNSDEEYAKTGDLDIRGTTFVTGEAGREVWIDGGGRSRIFDVKGERFTLSNVSLRNGRSDALGPNSRGQGGALRIGTESRVYVYNSRFLNNSAPEGYGGAIYSSAYVRLTGVTLSNNTAGGGGAFYAGYGSTAYFDRVLASENTALGGGTLMSAGYVSVLNSKFERNWATEGVGGAIAGTADLNVRNSVFLANSAKTKGGAIYYRSRDFLNPLYRLSVVHSVFTNNESTNGSGGAVSMNPGSVHDSLFENNAAVAAYGGALEGVSAIVNRSVFRNNSALSGGALQIYGTDVFSSAVYGNSASERGGAIHSSGGVRILNSTIDSNYAGVLGSAIAHELESLQIKNCTISDNGDGSSPAVWASVFASAWIGHTAIKGAGPRCDFDGGIVSAGYNVEDGASCGLTTGSDRQNTTVALGALAGNDGPTVGSPYFSYTATLPSRLPLGVRNALVDRGADFANQTDDLGSDGCLKLDVRGLARPEGRACDIGAVELEGLVSEPSPSSGT